MTRVGHSVPYSVFGDFVESHPLDFWGVAGFIDAERFQQMPGDGFAFAVGVSGQDQFIALVGFFFQQRDLFLAFGQDVVARLEFRFDIDRPLFAGQSANVAIGSQNLVVRAEKFFDGFGFSGRFDDHQGFSHERLNWLLTTNCQAIRRLRAGL